MAMRRVISCGPDGSDQHLTPAAMIWIPMQEQKWDSLAALLGSVFEY
ncbi:MAG: hypothetical protein K8L91_26525 [Anaerolineae bacterium]|nr:hypothetical protein [Anaerolineae bacterium]